MNLVTAVIIEQAIQNAQQYDRLQHLDHCEMLREVAAANGRGRRVGVEILHTSGINPHLWVHFWFLLVFTAPLWSGQGR